MGFSRGWPHCRARRVQDGSGSLFEAGKRPPGGKDALVENVPGAATSLDERNGLQEDYRSRCAEDRTRLLTEAGVFRLAGRLAISNLSRRGRA